MNLNSITAGISTHFIQERSRPMKRFISVFLVFLLFPLLSGCGEMQITDSPEVRSHVDIFLTATLENKPNAAYGAFFDAVSRAEFNTVFPQIRNLLKDVEEYTLSPIHVNYSKRSDGKSFTQMTYRMNTNNGVFLVTATSAGNKDGLLSIHLVPEEQTTLVHTGSPGYMKGASAFQWAVLILGFAIWGFVLWAFVDCCRRKIRKKPLWLLLVALGAVLINVTISGSAINFRYNVGIHLTVSTLLRYGDGSYQLRLLIPLGAILYLSLRRQLEKPASVPSDVPAGTAPQKTEAEE